VATPAPVASFSFAGIINVGSSGVGSVLGTTSDQRGGQAPNVAIAEADASAARSLESGRGFADTHSLGFLHSDDLEDADVRERLVVFIDWNVAAPYDSSLSDNIALALTTGGRRRADVLPQRGSPVASVATLLGDGSYAGDTGVAQSEGQLNHLLLSVLSSSPPGAGGTTSPAPDLDGSSELVVDAQENSAGIASWARPLILLPVLGWGIARAWRPREQELEVC
jgi:hypothetical protein